MSEPEHQQADDEADIERDYGWIRRVGVGVAVTLLVLASYILSPVPLILADNAGIDISPLEPFFEFVFPPLEWLYENSATYEQFIDWIQ